MIALARSRKATHFMQNSRATSGLAGKYVAGASAAEGLAKARSLKSEHGILSSLFHLGEYVDSDKGVDLNLRNKLEIAELLADSELDLHISVDPTQIGYQVAPDWSRENALKIASKIAEGATRRDGFHALMLDMEDATLVDPTIALHDDLHDQGLPVALTLQAYLRRTEADLKAQIERGARVRLVKGAFAADAKIAFTHPVHIKANSRRLIAQMFSPAARASGFFPVIATHDTELQNYTRSEAARNGWAPGEYEFEMLHGVRSDVAQRLAQDGEQVRLYLPFGRDWWPYAVRRIGENPKNAVLLARSLLS